MRRCPAGQSRGLFSVGGNDEQPGSAGWNDWDETEDSQTFPIGYASRQFVTDPEADLAVLSKPIVVAIRGEISDYRHIYGIMDVLNKSRRSLLLVAGLVTGEALSVLEVNKTRGVFQSVAVNCGTGAEGDDLLQAVTDLVGGQIVSDASEFRNSREPFQVGAAEAARISATSTILRPAAAVPPVPSRPDATAPAGRGRFGRRRQRS
jgi:hypothetical protein